jgi:exosome complex component RRP4
MMRKKEVRDLVVPGEFLGEGNAYFGTYAEGKKVYSKFLGILKQKENGFIVIPLAGVYTPKKNDKIIGIVQDIQMSGWVVDINSPWLAYMPLAEAVNEFVDIYREDISKYYDIGDIVYCKIQNVTKSMAIQLTMKEPGLKKLLGGVLIKITPSKVPRLIGRGGSMISLIKRKTGTTIIVGQNGLVWIKGEKVSKAVEAILTVEKESHTVGLTDKISKMLSE